MNSAEILQQLAPWREVYQRPAWKPIVQEGDGEVTASKFSGMPWLAEDEAYPCCQSCQGAMPLFLQLNLADLPAELTGRFGKGLLQLFYCTSDDCDGDGWEPFSDNKLVRLVQPSDRAQSLSTANYPSFPAKTIVGWTTLNDYPSPAEHDELGLIFTYDFSANTVKIQCPSLGLETAALPMAAVEAEAVAIAEPGDKLAGWPYWVQGVEYPNCPECDRRMELVFQLDSEDNLPFMFGDVGCGHITQCPEHKEVVTFAWACG